MIATETTGMTSGASTHHGNVNQNGSSPMSADKPNDDNTSTLILSAL
jgi:hypothetical protein